MPTSLLIEMTGDQAAYHWPQIADAFRRASENAGYPVTASQYNNCLQALIEGRMRALVFVVDGKARVIFITKILRDDISDQRDLFIYAAASVKPMDRALWVDCATKIVDHARRNECSSIFAISQNPQIVQIFTKFMGGNANRRLCVLEVN